MTERRRRILGTLSMCVVALVIAYLISGVAHCQTFEFSGVAHQILTSAPNDRAFAGSGQRGGSEAPAPHYRLVVSLSRQPSSVLRAVAGGIPEAAAIYSVRACSRATESTKVDPGQLEVAIVGAGVAVTPRPLAQLAVQRSRSRTLSVLARVGEAAAFAAPVVMGFAATGAVPLKAWQAAGISGLGAALRIAADASQDERGHVREPVSAVGAWLSEMPTMVLEPGQCTPAMLLMGSFDPRKRAEVLYLQ